MKKKERKNELKHNKKENIMFVKLVMFAIKWQKRHRMFL